MSLSAAEVSSMRAEADNFLPDTCTVQFATIGQDAMGGPAVTYPSEATGVACRMDEPKTGAAETAVDLAVGSVVSRIMHLKYDQAISAKDRVVYNSLTYEVIEVLEAASWLITRRIIVTRVE